MLGVLTPHMCFLRDDDISRTRLSATNYVLASYSRNDPAPHVFCCRREIDETEDNANEWEDVDLGDSWNSMKIPQDLIKLAESGDMKTK